MLKLPESQFTEINDYILKPADPMPDKYYKFVEKTLEELDKVLHKIYKQKRYKNTN